MEVSKRRAQDDVLLREKRENCYRGQGEKTFEKGFYTSKVADVT